MGKLISFMQAKKSLGQNFLIDKNIIDKIIDNINCKENDLIIEIGPGKGALTQRLKQKNCHIICYEIDNNMQSYLSKLENDNLKIIYQDILQSDIKKDISNICYDNLLVVGNLPYYITTPIIKYIINLNLDIKEMIFMVQEEVANRFTALPNTKEYGSMTLYLKYYFDIEKLFKVGKNSFKPVPKVESAIIKLTNRQDKPKVKKDKYFKLLNESFKMKRKTLKNNLKEYDFEKINKVLIKYKLKENVRAEELEEKVFLDIYYSLYE